MKIAVRMILVLALVGIASGAGLAFIFVYTKPQIDGNLRRETETAIYRIFPDADGYSKEKISGDEIFIIEQEGEPAGFAFAAEGYGYQGTIKMMIGIDRNLEKLRGIEILESQETPGLGQEISKDSFRNQFIGLDVTGPIAYVKNKAPSDPNEIQAITGATISSRAVVNIINEKVRRIKDFFRQGESG